MQLIDHAVAWATMCQVYRPLINTYLAWDWQPLRPNSKLVVVRTWTPHVFEQTLKHKSIRMCDRP